MNIDHIFMLLLCVAYIYMDYKYTSAINDVIDNVQEFKNLTRECLKQLYEAKFQLIERVEKLEKKSEVEE